ncbi:hypothetical protein TUN199_09137 [Pyrenophora tritici-repentis]|nr:hypothetical protein TUN199_09137 [Pyrenophora tritici-repentis]
MHASTIAAILAFTAGMSVNAAPVVGPQVISNTQPTELHTILGHAEADHKVSELAIDEVNTQPLTTRDPEARIGKGGAAKGVGGGLGALADIVTIGGLIGGQQQQKRDARIGKSGAAKGVGGGLGALADVVTIGGLIGGQQQQKRDARVAKNFGNAAKGVGGGVGALADVVTIGGLIGGQQKRDGEVAQPVARGERKVIGKAPEVEVGCISSELGCTHRIIGAQ